MPNSTYVVRVWRPKPNDPEYGSRFNTRHSCSNLPAGFAGKEQVDGLDRYHFTRNMTGVSVDGQTFNNVMNDSVTIDVDPSSRRLRVLKSEGLGTTLRIDYPASVPDSVFDVDQHEIRGLPIHDLDAERAQIDKTMRKGLGSQDGITLRLVCMDDAGELWALWTAVKADARDPFHPTP